MRVLVLGASGGCGRWVVRLAAEGGHDVVAVVRPETPFEGPTGSRVVRGSPLDPTLLRSLAGDRDAVISCIGPRRTNPRNPWSPLRPPAGVAASSARAAVEVFGGKRFVAISAAGVGDSRPEVNLAMGALLRWSTIGTVYADLFVMEEVLRASALDWTAVRPVTLVDAKPTGRTREVRRFGAFSIVGRADVAGWLLRVAAESGASGSRTPMIGWW